MLASPPSEIPFFFTHVFSWLLVFIGASFTRTALVGGMRAMGSKRWPTAKGRVVKCEVNSHTFSEDGPDIPYAEIEYSYGVGDAVYVGSRISLAGLDHTGAAAEAYVKKHPAGTSIAVFYDPKNPADALLEPGVRAHVLVKIVGALMLLSMGAAMVFAFKAWRF